MQITISQVASLVAGVVYGDEEGVLSGLKPLENAQAGDLSFLASFEGKGGRFVELARSSKARAILVPRYEESLEKTQIVVPNPMAAVIQLANTFRPALPTLLGVHPTAVLGQNVEIAEGVAIGAFSVIGDNVKIGAKTIIHPQVVIYPGAVIGQKCIIHAGAVIREYVVLGSDCVIQNGVVVGGDGFGYIPDKELGHRRIPHIGTVVLEDSVDLGANTTVDRAMLGETRLSKAAKIDNLVMIGHNVEIGERSLLCGQVGISGSSKIGSDSILAGQAGVADHITIGNKVRVAAKTGISSQVPDGLVVAGVPNVEASVWRRCSAALVRLPDLLRRVRRIERSLSLGEEDEN